MNPPDHIKGLFNAKTATYYRKARAEWIVEQHKAGHTYPDIAAAIGISPESARNAVRIIGYKPAKPDKRPQYADLHRCGLRFGQMAEPFFAMPDQARDAIIAKAAKTGKTVAQVLVDAYLEGVA